MTFPIPACRLPAAWTGLAALICCARMAIAAEDLPRAQDCSFQARFDNSTQRYVRLEPDQFDPGATHHLLVVLHGHGADRWQYLRESRAECLAARQIAARFSMILISPDYRAATSWMGPAAESDLVQLIGELRSQDRIGKVFVSGGSMGGAAALTFAAMHPELVDGAVALNGAANLLEFANFQPAIEASFGGSKVQIPEEYKKRSAEYWPERLAMPIAIAAGGQDTVVPADSVVRLARILKTLQRSVLLIFREEGGHSTNHEDSIAAYEFVVQAVLNPRDH